jgi:hypothetical protein
VSDENETKAEPVTGIVTNGVVNRAQINWIDYFTIQSFNSAGDGLSDGTE